MQLHIKPLNLVKIVETESFKNWIVNYIANRNFKICFWPHECESPDDPLANKVTHTRSRGSKLRSDWTPLVDTVAHSSMATPPG